MNPLQTSRSYQISTVEEWDQVVKDVMHKLYAPMIIALSGPLGAGKTTFVQQLAYAWGIKERPRSPTFSLLRTYALPYVHGNIKRLVHIDAYRLEKRSDVYALDLESELTEPGTILAIEWPEQIEEIIKECQVPIVRMKMKIEGMEKRIITIT